MDRITIGKSKLAGSIKIPASKSMSHRAIMAAGLAKGKSIIRNLIFSKDIIATIACMENIGAKIERHGDHILVEGLGGVKLVNYDFYCNESGSTIRFMIPIGMMDRTNTQPIVFHGEGRLATRPMTPYFNIFEEKNIQFDYPGQLPLTIWGNLESGTYKLPGDVSSQFVTGLMYALSLGEGESTIEMTSKLESRSYVDMTIDVMKSFGIAVSHDDYNKFYVAGNSRFEAKDYTVEGDYSQVAFFVVAGLINGDLTLTGLKETSLQGDSEIINIIKRMGGDICFEGDSLKVKKSQTHGVEIDMSEIPDMLPAISVLAALSKGRTRLYNGQRIRLKESDRIKAMYTELTKLGANIQETEDGLLIDGVDQLNGGQVEGWNDHRIVMALSVAGTCTKEALTISDAQAISKSYPHFFEDLKSIGGIIHE
jgi:3-phosphoshikimate 1-carboxyvinyltransferase